MSQMIDNLHVVFINQMYNMYVHMYDIQIDKHMAYKYLHSV